MKKFRCTVCGYVYEGDAAPEKCPLCKAPASKFVEVEEATADGPLVFADEHVIGVAKGCDDEMIKDLNNHFMGECTEVGMYLAMSRQADREGYPEVADIIRKSKFPQNPKRSVRFSGKRTKRSVQKRKARNTQKAETKVL